jgi:hypothetical protein
MGQLDAIAKAAVAIWDRVQPGAARLLAGTRFEIVDLPADELGRTTVNTVEIDTKSDGYGWFVDATPGRNEEFRGRTSAGSSLAIRSAAAGHMDLLTVVLHELGHVLGRPDLDGPSLSGDLMYESLRELTLEAKAAGLIVVVWSYPRGSSISKEGETAVDVAGYAAQIACQLGAHIVKVKLPTAHIEQDAARKVYEKEKIPIGTAAERVRHVVQCAFDGKRIVIFSGGAKKDKDEDVMNEIRAIREGGGFGSIIGRNTFQRPKPLALEMLNKIIDIYKNGG